MNLSVISCSRCGHPVAADAFDPQFPIGCPGGCGATLFAAIFPAFWRRPEPVRAETTGALPDQATCFQHADNKAEAVCDQCGRFLCAHCAVNFKGRRLCPSCIHMGFKLKRFADLDQERYLYDELALALALLPFLVFPILIVTAPIAIYVAVRYWRAPTSLVGRSRFRQGAAVFFALLGLAVWGLWVHAITR